MLFFFFFDHCRSPPILVPDLYLSSSLLSLFTLSLLLRRTSSYTINRFAGLKVQFVAPLTPSLRPDRDLRRESVTLPSLQASPGYTSHAPATPFSTPPNPFIRRPQEVNKYYRRVEAYIWRRVTDNKWVKYYRCMYTSINEWYVLRRFLESLELTHELHSYLPNSYY